MAAIEPEIFSSARVRQISGVADSVMDGNVDRITDFSIRNFRFLGGGFLFAGSLAVVIQI